MFWKFHNKLLFLQLIYTPENKIYIDNMTTKKSAALFLVAAVLITAISFLISTAGAYADMSYYMDANYFGVWSKLMMPTAGPPPVEFTYISIVFSLITALIFCFVYIKIKNVFSTKTTTKAGLIYGCGVFLIAGIPSTLSLILLINLPLALIISWAVQSLVMYLISGIIAAKLIK
jgi:hypothetical protein